jgi:hypothetical protein
MKGRLIPHLTNQGLHTAQRNSGVRSHFSNGSFAAEGAENRFMFATPRKRQLAVKASPVAMGHKRTNQKSLSPQHRGDVCDDAGEPKQNMDANDCKKDRRSGGYREPAMLVIHCKSPASSTSTTNVENIQHRAIRCRLAGASGYRPRQQAL